jgi:branched-chain amino acid transport system substrate-binding protein
MRRLGKLLRGKPLTAGAALAAGAIALAACSSAGSSGSSSGTGASAAKSPFTFAVLGTPLTSRDYTVGITSALKAINAAGGIDGHPLQEVSCSDNNDVNQASTCAQQAISNSSVLSFVSSSSSYGTGFEPLIQKAGMANFANLLSTAADDSSPASFPLYGGTFDSIVSAVAATQLLHAARIGVPYMAIPAGAQLPPFITQVVKGKASVVGTQSIPITTTDFTPYAAAEISAKPDVVVDGLTSDMYTKFIQAIRQQGDTGMKFLVAAGVFDASQVKSLFGNDNAIYLVNQYDHAAPGYKKFLSDVSTYDPGATDRNDSVLSGWIGVEGFAQILKALIAEGHTSPTRADVVSYLNKQTNFDVQGLTQGINYTKPNTTQGGALARVFIERVWISQVVGGTEVPLNGGKAFSMPT